MLHHIVFSFIIKTYNIAILYLKNYIAKIQIRGVITMGRKNHLICNFKYTFIQALNTY